MDFRSSYRCFPVTYSQARHTPPQFSISASRRKVPTTGTLGYAGVGAPLVGSGIDVDD